MEFTALQILPPKDWGRFEDLCRALFAAVWADPYTQKNGRAGQAQHGVDIWGRSGGSHPGTHCVQCKGKDASYGGKVTTAEFDAEIAKAEGFTPAPAHWLLATTAPNDGTLQEHARLRSAEREAHGLFPVTILGWETLVALMGEHGKVIEQFYPEHGDRLPELIEAVRALPQREEWLASIGMLAERWQAREEAADPAWHAVRFDRARGLGPALAGRALGAADAMQCPRLPEANELVRDLKTSFSARLAGVPGAGKSVCALQAAEIFAGEGYRIVRLSDPAKGPIRLSEDDVPTLHLIDDAHLASPNGLALAEQSTSSDKLLLSAFTSVDAAGTRPGTIHLDAARAVRVIAEDLRARRSETLAAVRTIDDWVGDGIGEENIDWRLDAAALSDFPWQFCFVLSGGWRRVRSIVASARAAGADIVLAAVAIRQLATRDARASAADLGPLLEAARIPRDVGERAIAWLVAQRLVLGAHDLRCPHQRFSAEVFDPILRDQDKTGRQQVVAMMGHVLAAPDLSLAGVGSLLTQFRMSRRSISWTHLVGRELLQPFLDRCWKAEAPTDVAAAANALREIDSYIEDYIKRPTKAQIQTVARWFSRPLPGAAYQVGNYINGTYRNRRFGRAIIRASDPDAVADALNAAMAPGSADFACEIAKMVTLSAGALTAEWKARYLARIDRDKALALVAQWPAATSIYRATWFCEHLAFLGQAFGFDCIEALAPAIAARMRDDPIEAFEELHDIFGSSLRVFDPLDIYKGKRAPTARSWAISRLLCSAWEPKDLAAKLSQITPRRFQGATRLMYILRRSDPERCKRTVAALDWNAIDAAFGDSWAKLPHDADRFISQCYASKAGRKDIARLIEAHVEEMDVLDARFAYFAPKAAYRQVERNAQVGISSQWSVGAAVLAHFHKHRPDLVDALLAGHPAAIAKSLSSDSLHCSDNDWILLAVCRQIRPDIFADILDQIDVGKTEEGWRKGLVGSERRRKPFYAPARITIAWLVHAVRDKPGLLGDLARRLLVELPQETKISPKKLEPIKGL